MVAYETRAVLDTVDQHTLPILGLCALALVGNYIFWIENLRLGFRHRTYSMPVGSLLFFLPHDGTFVAMYSHWFHDIDHWFPKLWWFGLCVTVCMELTFLVMLLKYGRKELAPAASQKVFSAVIILGLILCTIAWLVVKSTMNDELFLIIFGVTIFWCAPFNLGLMMRRRSSVGQSQFAWFGYLLMPLFYWPATLMLSPGFHSPLCGSRSVLPQSSAASSTLPVSVHCSVAHPFLPLFKATRKSHETPDFGSIGFDGCEQPQNRRQ